MIHRSSDGDLDVPELDVTSFVLERAEALGEKPALIEGPSGRELSYAELARATRRLAAGLASRGFGKGDVLGVFMPNIPEYAVAFHGAAAAGGMCTTMNPLYTAKEVAQQLEDSGARILLTVPAFLEAAAEAAERAGVKDVFVVGEAEGALPFSELLGDPDEAPVDDPDPGSVAVLPYSSGTTGLPKGVMLTHRNLVANLSQIQVGSPIEADDTVIGCLPFFHIYGMTVIMNQGLLVGATIVTMPRFDLEQFLELIEVHGATQLYVVPPIALALAKHPAVDGRDLSTVRTITCGAAPLGAELADRVEERVGSSVIQGYGLTETSPVTHLMRPHWENRPGSIGRPVPMNECRIIDPESGEDVDGAGERGELWIRGPQVMMGYLNNPEATAATVDAEGWLHSGDIGTADADGFFRIVDRLKELIKYKGFQVAPAELEALITTHPAVADVAVIGVADEEAGELPKAFVVPAGEELDPDELMAWVAEQVSPQKRIRLVEAVEEIPKSPSGKILRRVLVERERAKAGA